MAFVASRKSPWRTKNVRSDWTYRSWRIAH